MKKESIKITSPEEYKLCYRRGFEPLIDPLFNIDINLRIWIQKKLFGVGGYHGGSRAKANQKFYHWIIKNKLHICEETLINISDISAVNVSHILTRGAFAEMAHDPRNVNILSKFAHDTWEDKGGVYTKKGMRIYSRNQKIIKKLKNEYS